MKKIFLKMVCLVLCAYSFAFVSCKESDGVEELNLYENGIETALVIDTMARNETYKAYINIDYDVKSILAEDYRNPTNVYSISIPTYEELFHTVEAGRLEEEWDSLPDIVKEQMEERKDLLNLIMSLYSGEEKVGISSVYQAALHFEGRLDEKIAYLYVYETGVPIVVTFTPVCDYCYSASGRFFFGVDCTSLEKIEEVFGLYNCEVVTVK